MKRNDIQKLATLTIGELHAQLTEVTTQLAKARLEKQAGKLSNPRLVSTYADNVARIKTIIKEKELTQ